MHRESRKKNSRGPSSQATLCQARVIEQPPSPFLSIHPRNTNTNMAKPYETGAGIHFWGPYDGWMQEQCPIKPNVEHKEEEKGKSPFEYRGQEVTLTFISEIVNLLKENNIPRHVINDALWRFYGCQNRITTIDLETNEYDRSGKWRSGERYFIGALCPYLWKAPRGLVGARPCLSLAAGPSHEHHVDLNLFRHEEYFFHLPSPGSNELWAYDQLKKEQSPIYIDSTDVALEREVEEPYAVKILCPARMVEALIRLSFQDRYLRSPMSQLLSDWQGWNEWDRTLVGIFCSITGRAGEEEARRRVRTPGFQLRVNKTLLEVDADHPEETLLTLKGLKPLWFRLKDFQPLFQEYLQALFLTRRNDRPCKPSPPPQQEQKQGHGHGQDQKQSGPYPREWLDHSPILPHFQHWTAFSVMNEFAWRFKEAGLFPPGSPFYVEKTTRAIKALNHPRRPFDSLDDPMQFPGFWQELAHSRVEWQRRDEQHARTDPWSRHYCPWS
ncbi:hypothetical protein BO82DRAFT_363148 [Aspergillus uvarum CBS 121591]|uniref:Uncharacterized protein n=1 Tax=Aspergillus uvarum CBS 121591 TaxID=1448315 RepID=A0A319CH03_9EURO|nr:hypothetical protein BO82DRAFT_363148 [Aspergillus uvarum CBS 121591]PYH83569.1 hypothetical protein BO82DRAFT_363148 [Aspergillus uvarum CBS 121591]